MVWTLELVMVHSLVMSDLMGLGNNTVNQICYFYQSKSYQDVTTNCTCLSYNG